MNFEIRERKAAQEKAMAIFVGKEEVGQVEQTQINVNGHQLYMASISLGDGLEMITGATHGFGKSPEAAVANAFIKGRQRAANYIKAINEMERKVMGSEVAA